MSRFQTTFSKPHPLQVADAEARLARSNLKSLVSMGQEARSSSDSAEAVDVIKKQFGLNDGFASQAHTKIVKILQEADLTINFMGHKWFQSRVTGGYTTCWERGTDHHNDIRDEVEEKMFHYKDAKVRHWPTASPATGSYMGGKIVVDQISKYGSQLSESNTFNGKARPRYAGVNFAGRPNGAAETWGKSFLILKEHTKHNATYIPVDSFSATKQQLAAGVSDYFNMSLLIVNMSPDMRKLLFNKAVTGKCDMPSASNYIEAHMHCDISFARDVEALCVSSTELNGASMLKRAKMKYNINRFQKDFGCPVRYVP